MKISRVGKNFIERSRKPEGFDKGIFEGSHPDFQPAYAWVWNDKITLKEVKRRLEGMKKAGIGCVYILPEPKNFRPRTMRTFMEPEYMTDEYLELCKKTAAIADELGLRMWIYDEGGWPSGGACGLTVAKNPRLVSKGLRKKEKTLKAGEKYTPEENEIASFIEGKRIKAGESFEEEHELEVVSLQYSNGWNTDSLEKEIGRTFVDVTHRRYQKAMGEILGNQIPLMFTDEPGTGSFPWPDDFSEIFKTRYGYDLTDCLPALWQEDEETEKFRVDYRELQGELFRENYLKPIHDWCREVGMLSTGHLDIDHRTDGCLVHGYGHVLPQLREMDIPGVDVIWQQIGMSENGKTCPEGNGFFERFASSAAAQIGGKLALSESFAVYGEGVSGELARMTLNHQLVRGINLFNFMLTSYSPRLALALVERPVFMEEKPGFTHLKGINDYTARASYLMQLGRPGLTTALFYPAREIWAGGEKKKKSIESFEKLGRELEEAQVEFDIIDEEGLRLSVPSEDGSLVMGLARYDTVLIPKGVILPEDLRRKTAGLVHEAHSAFMCSEKDIRVRTRLLPDGSTLYMLFNEGKKEMVLPLVFPEEREGVELDADRAKIRKIGKEGRFLPGEAKFFLFGSAERREREYSREKLMTLEDFTLERRHEMLLTKEGLSHRYLLEKAKPITLGSWENDVGDDFSGEALYRTRFTLKEISVGEKLMLSFGRIERSARVTLNGSELGILWVDPREISFEASLLKEENILEIEVANTPVNRIQAADVKTMFDPTVLGPYEEKESVFEEKAPRGGLYGPVELWQLN